MPYFAYVLEHTDGRYQAIKVFAETEAHARSRVETAGTPGLGKLEFVGATQAADRGHELYEKACAKAQKLEAKRRAAAQPHECNAVTAKLF